MALPNEIQVGRYNRFVQKLLSIKGKATTYLASPEIDFVIPLFYGAENRYLEGWDLFAIDVSPGVSGVGNSTIGQLRNPVGSNVVAVISRAAWFESVATNTGSGASCQIFRSRTVDFATLRTSVGLDARGRAASTCIVSDAFVTTVPAGGVGMGLITQPANTVADFFLAEDEFPLLPGMAFIMIAGAANDLTNYNLRWRERFLEDSERA